MADIFGAVDILYALLAAGALAMIAFAEGIAGGQNLDRAGRPIPPSISIAVALAP
jgi:hypothetical protein